MAARENLNNHHTVEPVVNRWLIDYYFSLALEFFEQEKYEDFVGVWQVLESVSARPLEVTDATQIKLRILQFLFWISDGEYHDTETADRVSPLESALSVLEHLNQEYSIPQQDFENVCTSLKEMIVGIFIKNSEFGKAEQMLNKHFPKPMVGKKAIFMGLIRKKIKTHEVIEQMDFQQFSKEMLVFCQRLCPFNVSFLQKAATMCIDKRVMVPDNKVVGLEGQDEPGPHSSPSSSLQISTNVKFVLGCTISRSGLEAAYDDLAAGSETLTFAQLDNEVRTEERAKKELSLRLPCTPQKSTNEDSEQEQLFQRDSTSPMEASPADHPSHVDANPRRQSGSCSKATAVQRKRRLYTVAQLVVEPDSQGSSQCSTDQSPPSADLAKKKDLQNAATTSGTSTHRPSSAKGTKRTGRYVTESELSPYKTPEREPFKQLATSSLSKKSRVSPPERTEDRTASTPNFSDSEEELDESLSICKTPVQKIRQQTHEADDTDGLLDSSPTLFPPSHPVPQTSSTPQKASNRDKGHSTKWKDMVRNAKESKEVWSFSDDFGSSKTSGSHNESSSSNSSQRKKMWSESETRMLIEGVKKYGEGQWNKIKMYYSFKDRSNVSLKDRWRTLKKLKVI